MENVSDPDPAKYDPDPSGSGICNTVSNNVHFLCLISSDGKRNTQWDILEGQTGCGSPGLGKVDERVGGLVGGGGGGAWVRLQ